jgi:hypothetical protein
MRRSILLTMLILSMNGKLFAQQESTEFYKSVSKWSKEDKTFNTTVLPNFKDFVYLKNAKMIVDIINISDYKYLYNIDSVLVQFRKDIAFYKDSLENGTGNVRIDYVLNSSKEFKQIRFIKYRENNDIYVNRHGETERLKLEQDTVRVIMQNITGTAKPTYWMYPIEITFVLNNYTDIDKVIAQKTLIQHAFDTLVSVRTQREIKNPYRFPSSCIYKPYYSPSSFDTTYMLRNPKVYEKYKSRMHFVKFNEVLKQEFGQFRSFGLPAHHVAAYGNIGAGLVRNTLSPSADLGISYINYYRRGQSRSYEFNTLFASSYFFFDRQADGQFLVSDNWFINIESGSSYDEEMLGVKIRGFSVGAGYLAWEKGNYFKGTTMKVFASVRLLSGLSICPELIATNNFKQIFPGLTFKIFGVKRELNNN